MKRIVQILLMALISGTLANAQNSVSGIILDDRGEPVYGATIIEQGTTDNFVLTDEHGGFKITPRLELPTTLVISAVGLKRQELGIYEITAELLKVQLKLDNVLSEVVITARRRTESAQEAPLAVSVLKGSVVDESGSFNVNRMKELVPSVQLYSSNPRNTTLNIRGLGSTFGLTNDGIDPGVGFYVDGVYYARPAVTMMDFIDIEQIEILRGPQGTLFGKNTTAGAFNITTRQAAFDPSAGFELSYGNYGFIQAKSYITGAILKDKVAGRLSFSGTQRDGTVYNLPRNEYVNDLNNIGVRAQILYKPTNKIDITVTGDATRQRPNGYAQVVAGVVTTQRPDFRQFNSIIADLNYELPTNNAFDRIIDHDVPWKSENDLGGLSVNFNIETGSGLFTATSAWRYWNWGPSNDRDFTGLPVLTLSQAPSKHNQFSQEFRYAGSISRRVGATFGAFAIWQDLKSNPYHQEESGSAQWRFSQNTQNPLWQTPGLLDGYGIKTTNRLQSFSGAIFVNLDWKIVEKLNLIGGLRFNHDTKSVNYDRVTYGGLETDDPELLALKARVYTPQAFVAEVSNNNLSGNLTLKYSIHKKVNSYYTFSTNYKPVGINLGGLPTIAGEPMLELAEIKPEYVLHNEIGIKTTPSKASVLNFAAYYTNIEDYQTIVQTPELGVNRGFLANAGQVRVYGAEIDASQMIGSNASFFTAFSFTEAEYVTFTNAPVPLEEVGGEKAFKDISGGKLPGISRFAGSFGGEITSNQLTFFNQKSKFFFAVEGYYRSWFSSSPSPSEYLNIDGYALLNARLGLRSSNDGLSLFVWSRNLTNRNYYEQLLVASGSNGQYAAVLGDPRTYGITLRYQLGR